MVVRELTERFAVPVFLIESVAVPCAPTATSPKASDAGLTRTSGVAGATAVAERLIMTVGFAGSLVAKESVPVDAPAAVGAKITSRDAVCPASTASELNCPLNAKPLPVTTI